MNNKSYLTAISRKKLSRPMKYIDDNIYFTGINILDYGCGRGNDADILGLDKYDPYYQPALGKKSYHIITCNYVLNVVQKKEEKKILKHIKSLLVKGGVAYISVRRDKFKEGYTSKGTYQRYVKLDLPVLHKGDGYILYEMRRK